MSSFQACDREINKGDSHLEVEHLYVYEDMTSSVNDVYITRGDSKFVLHRSSDGISSAIAIAENHPGEDSVKICLRNGIFRELNEEERSLARSMRLATITTKLEKYDLDLANILNIQPAKQHVFTKSASKK